MSTNLRIYVPTFNLLQSLILIPFLVLGSVPLLKVTLNHNNNSNKTPLSLPFAVERFGQTFFGPALEFL